MTGSAVCPTAALRCELAVTTTVEKRSVIEKRCMMASLVGKTIIPGSEVFVHPRAWLTSVPLGQLGGDQLDGVLVLGDDRDLEQLGEDGSRELAEVHVSSLVAGSTIIPRTRMFVHPSAWYGAVSGRSARGTAR